MTKANGKLMRNLVRKLGREEGLKEFYERLNPKPVQSVKEPKAKKEPKGENVPVSNQELGR